MRPSTLHSKSNWRPFLLGVIDLLALSAIGMVNGGSYSAGTTKLALIVVNVLLITLSEVASAFTGMNTLVDDISHQRINGRTVLGILLLAFLGLVIVGWVEKSTLLIIVMGLLPFSCYVMFLENGQRPSRG